MNLFELRKIFTLQVQIKGIGVLRRDGAETVMFALSGRLSESETMDFIN